MHWLRYNDSILIYPLFLLWNFIITEVKSFCQTLTIKWGAWYKLKCWRIVLWPNICQHVHIGIMVYVFMRALFQVISVLGIYLICWTKINAAGQAIVPQLGFNRPRWNRTDLRRNQNRNRNGACQVWILGAALYGGKPSERRLITFRWPGSSPSDDVNVCCVFCVCVLVCRCVHSVCSFSHTLNIALTKTMRWVLEKCVCNHIKTPETPHLPMHTLTLKVLCTACSSTLEKIGMLFKRVLPL